MRATSVKVLRNSFASLPGAKTTVRQENFVALRVQEVMEVLKGTGC
jgi:hypothetical protein